MDISYVLVSCVLRHTWSSRAAVKKAQRNNSWIKFKWRSLQRKGLVPNVHHKDELVERRTSRYQQSADLWLIFLVMKWENVIIQSRLAVEVLCSRKVRSVQYVGWTNEQPIDYGHRQTFTHDPLKWRTWRCTIVRRDENQGHGMDKRFLRADFFWVWSGRGTSECIWSLGLEEIKSQYCAWYADLVCDDATIAQSHWNRVWLSVNLQAFETTVAIFLV